MPSWGVHSIINLARCNPFAIRCPNVIANFSNDLVRRIDMKAYGPPMIQHFGEGNKTGYTLVQLIETSNITAHFAEETNDAYIDVFSCKDYDPAEVVRCVVDHFKPHHVGLKVVQRQAGEEMQ